MSFPQPPLQTRKQEESLKARGSTGESWSHVPQAAAGSDCPLGDRGSGPATCSLGYSPRCICTTSAPLLPLVTWVTLGHGQEAPFGLGTFAPSNVPMTSRSCCRVEFPTTPSPYATTCLDPKVALGEGVVGNSTLQQLREVMGTFGGANVPKPKGAS